jgi:hypothetical protein
LEQECIVIYLRVVLQDVFMNADEFADELAVTYSGKTRNIPVIFESDGERDRVKIMRDNVA